MKLLIEFNPRDKKDKENLIEFLEDVFNDYPYCTDDKQFKVIKTKKGEHS